VTADASSLPALDRLAGDLVATVRRAGEAVMAVYDSDFAVAHKDDRSPVTAADQAAEDIIVADLRRLTPQIPVVAEEAAAAGDIPDIGDGPFWLVDPLDGTKEFIRRNGEFTVNIGLIVDRRPVLGLVLAPALKTLYVGWMDGEAGTCWRETADGGRQAIAVRRPGPQGVVVLASRSHADSEALQVYLKDIPVASTRNAGSSLKFCRIAEGAADLYPRLGPTCEWDTAAAHAVLRAAGGTVERLDGAPFLYGKASDKFLNPFFVAKGDLT
jgi:3'(2'), 5'-bisphosphate nucleotidase